MPVPKLVRDDRASPFLAELLHLGAKRTYVTARNYSHQVQAPIHLVQRHIMRSGGMTVILFLEVALQVKDIHLDFRGRRHSHSEFVTNKLHIQATCNDRSKAVLLFFARA